MSAEVMARLAAQWGLTLQQTREHIIDLLSARGVIGQQLPGDSVGAYKGEPLEGSRYITLGVDDASGRIAVLGDDDEVLIWLDAQS